MSKSKPKIKKHLLINGETLSWKVIPSGVKVKPIINDATKYFDRNGEKKPIPTNSNHIGYIDRDGYMITIEGQIYPCYYATHYIIVDKSYYCRQLITHSKE